MERKTIHKQESYGGIGSFGIEIIVSADKLPDLKKDSISKAVYDSVDSIMGEICEAIKNASPKTGKETARNRELVDLFPALIFVEEIPNEYCSDWCCKHLPWFIVTTSIGRFKIGWRKSVINIDWAETVNKKSGKELFEGECVTKGEYSIHAWSTEKAREYIETIIESVNK